MRIAAFGNSFTAAETYDGRNDKSWLDLMQVGPFGHELFGNYAEGGAVSGPGDHYAYEMDGQIIEATGLLGQIKTYLYNPQRADTHVIWSPVNDLVIASMLDPFVTRDGVTVKTTKLVTEFRDTYITEQGHSKVEYGEYVISQYLVGNIHKAIQMLRDAKAENIVIIGYLDLGAAEVAHQSEDHQAVATALSKKANMLVSDLCFNYGIPFINPFNIRYVTIDEIHPAQATNEAVAAKILTECLHHI